jgi:hypothetical protein
MAIQNWNKPQDYNGEGEGALAPCRCSEALAINYPVTVDAKKLRALIWTGDAIIRATDAERVARWKEIREIICAQMQMPQNEKLCREQGGKDSDAR